MTSNRRVDTAVLCPPLIPGGQTIKPFAHPTGLAANRLVGCVGTRRRIDRDRCASRCSAHPTSLGEKIKDGKNQKTVLTAAEEQRIIDVFNAKQQEEDFSVVVSYRDIADKNYSLSAGQYFDVKIEYVDIMPEQFAEKMQAFNDNLDGLFNKSRDLEVEIKNQLAGLKYE